MLRRGGAAGVVLEGVVAGLLGVEDDRVFRELRVRLVSFLAVTFPEIVLPGLTGLTLMDPLRPVNFGLDANFWFAISLTTSTMKLRQVAAAVLLAPQVGRLLSLPSHTPVTIWGM